MESDRLIFVGFELTSELDEGLVDPSSPDRAYLDDPVYLEMVEIDGVRYIGKRVSDGIAVDRLEDTARNVVSLMARVARGFDGRAADALVIAVEESGTPGIDVASEGGEGFDYSGLVD